MEGHIMIKNVLIDLDDTIFDFHEAERLAIKKALDTMGVDSSEEILALYSEINKGCWERLETGEWTREMVLVGRFKLLFAELGVGRDPVEARNVYERLLSVGHIFIDGAVELLEELRGEYRLYLVSNGTDVVQTRRISSAGIESYFDGIFISERLGANKPSEQFFNAVFSSIPDFDKEQTVIIGDSPTSDILGGIRSGIKTVRFNPKCSPDPKDIKPDYTVTSLADIPNLLKQL